MDSSKENTSSSHSSSKKRVTTISTSSKRGKTSVTTTSSTSSSSSVLKSNTEVPSPSPNNNKKSTTNQKKTSKKEPCDTEKARKFCYESVKDIHKLYVPKGRGKKNVHRTSRNRGKKKSFETYVLTEKESLLKKGLRNIFYFFDWSGKNETISLDVNTPVNLFSIHDVLEECPIDWDNVTHDQTTLIYKDNSNEIEDDDFVMAKLSKCQSKEVSNSEFSSFQAQRELFPKAIYYKPKTKRGSKNSSVLDASYACYGFTHAYRPEKDLFPYVFDKQKASKVPNFEAMGYDITNRISKLASEIECKCKRVIKGVKNYPMFQCLKSFIELPSVVSLAALMKAKMESTETSSDMSETKNVDKNIIDNDLGICTQVALASNGYWSQLHVDDDFFLSILSVMCVDSDRDDEVLYYFTFPSFDVTVPMKAGNILIFNSLYEHCCSNPRNPNDYIYSMYVSSAAVDTKMRKIFRESESKK